MDGVVVFGDDGAEFADVGAGDGGGHGVEDFDEEFGALEEVGVVGVGEGECGFTATATGTAAATATATATATVSAATAAAGGVGVGAGFGGGVGDDEVEADFEAFVDGVVDGVDGDAFAGPGGGGVFEAFGFFGDVAAVEEADGEFEAGAGDGGDVAVDGVAGQGAAGGDVFDEVADHLPRQRPHILQRRRQQLTGHGQAGARRAGGGVAGSARCGDGPAGRGRFRRGRRTRRGTRHWRKLPSPPVYCAAFIT
ncbi:Uncharacterised protein [Nocardia africana]|uniref:Uncharacterized protein n=1 Tax=Nocardia africana TaxID=134964 RepID=A0A378X150_9NOCA|nr:Uncharacterised protein [Nocardia africana]